MPSRYSVLIRASFKSLGSSMVRLKRLWAGAAPGSLGPIATQRVPSPVAASASNLKASTLR